jgi:hypothetical protein
MSRAEEVLLFCAKQLVDEPDEVRVEVDEDGRGLVLNLYVAADDVGKVIGRRGRTARALRTVVQAAGGLDGDKVLVEIVD